MKKIVYLCGMMLMTTNMMAQIDPNDRNWECVLNDDFNNNRWDTWDSWLISHPQGHYKAFIPEWPSGVSRDSSEHQVYQRENCLFGNDGSLRLVSVYEGGANLQPLQCGDYDIPPEKNCDTDHRTLFYTSGKIETEAKFLYGYFEIRCSLPTHEGSFPAFWLYGAGNNYYNEIDIFEYSNGMDPLYEYRKYNCAILCNNYDINNPVVTAQTFATLPAESSNLRDFHVFGCEWMPDRVTWFVDGVAVFEELNSENIPQYPMALKINYAIDNYAVPHTTHVPIWFDGDEMIIDYIRVYQLKTDCEDDVVIQNVQDLMDYQPSVKHSISFEPTAELIVPTDTDITMRAETITIGNGFTLPYGAKMTLRTQICPE